VTTTGASGSGANGVSRMPVEEAGAGSTVKAGDSGSEVDEDCAFAPKAAKNTRMNSMTVDRIDNSPRMPLEP